MAEYIEMGSDSNVELSGLETGKCTEEDVRTVFAGVHTALTAALRTPKLKSAVSEEFNIIIASKSKCTCVRVIFLRVALTCI